MRYSLLKFCKFLVSGFLKIPSTGICNERMDALRPKQLIKLLIQKSLKVMEQLLTIFPLKSKRYFKNQSENKTLKNQSPNKFSICQWWKQNNTNNLFTLRIPVFIVFLWEQIFLSVYKKITLLCSELLNLCKSENQLLSRKLSFILCFVEYKLF